ncbi:MAG: 50S ribosomal protein L35 [candidate division Zixibacteria bacterium]|nr:50S ribosomal protein L35 [candidate division Zixibacteria bacterium]
MPKMKTNRSAAKRIKKTSTGKMKRFRAKHRHILTKKSPKQKRRLRSSTLIAKSDLRQMRVMLPY